jgi:cell division protein FtsB
VGRDQEAGGEGSPPLPSNSRVGTEILRAVSSFLRKIVGMKSGARRKDSSFLKALNRVLMFLTFVGAICIVALWFYPELQRRDAMVKNLEEKQAILAAEEARNRQQTREVYLLENDREYIETIARDRLDMMKEGETIYRLDSQKATPKAGTK